MKSTHDTRKPYSGTVRSLVIALDVGTTFSGVSYAILEPGEVPKIHGVTRFPGQEHVAGNSKIPSVMYYDRHGKLMAAGAEADTASVQSQAEDEGWIKTELFKLRLRPSTMKLKMNGLRLEALPRSKTAVDVFGDFLGYLYRCTKTFFIDTHANGPALWQAVEHDIQFILSHPNGWEGAQQTKMRRSAVCGGLISDTNEGKARIRFVTEGEASLHACVLSGLAADVLSSTSTHGFLVADAGGGTLDISSYAIRGTSPLVIEEIAPPDCIFAGSVFVSRRAREFLEGKLKNSRYGTPDALDHITRRFDETTKRLFRDKRDLQFIPFGSPLDKDPSVGIRGGQLKLTGEEVAELFEPSVQAAFAAIRNQIEASSGIIKSVWLVGGFAASPWLFHQLQELLAPLGVTVSRPDTQTSKAVADGAIGFYSDHHVSARMSKYMYGVEYLREFNAADPEHVVRKDRLCELPSGPKLLPDAFDCILARSVKVKESTVFTRKYCTELTSLSLLSVFEVEIWCYRGGNTIPKWILRQAEDFSTLCVVRADLSPLASSAEPKAGKNGKTYWTIVFSVEIHFGLTEFKARIKWVDDGKTKYGPASIIYNESGHRGEEDEPDSSPEDEMTISSSHSASRAPSREGYSRNTPHSAPHSTPGSKRASTYGTPINGGFTEIPDVIHADRDRTSKVSSSRASPSATAKGLQDTPRVDRAKEPPMEILERGRAKQKGKERERSLRPEDPSAVSRIGETLNSVWGDSTSPAASPNPPAGTIDFQAAPSSARSDRSVKTPKADVNGVPLVGSLDGPLGGDSPVSREIAAVGTSKSQEVKVNGIGASGSADPLVEARSPVKGRMPARTSKGREADLRSEPAATAPNGLPGAQSPTKPGTPARTPKAPEAELKKPPSPAATPTDPLLEPEVEAPTQPPPEVPEIAAPSTDVEVKTSPTVSTTFGVWGSKKSTTKVDTKKSPTVATARGKAGSTKTKEAEPKNSPTATTSGIAWGQGASSKTKDAVPKSSPTVQSSGSAWSTAASKATTLQNKVEEVGDSPTVAAATSVWGAKPSSKATTPKNKVEEVATSPTVATTTSVWGAKVPSKATTPKNKVEEVGNSPTVATATSAWGAKTPNKPGTPARTPKTKDTELARSRTVSFSIAAAQNSERGATPNKGEESTHSPAPGTLQGLDGTQTSRSVDGQASTQDQDGAKKKDEEADNTQHELGSAATPTGAATLETPATTQPLEPVANQRAAEEAPLSEKPGALVEMSAFEHSQTTEDPANAPSGSAAAKTGGQESTTKKLDITHDGQTHDDAGALATAAEHSNLGAASLLGSNATSSLFDSIQSFTSAIPSLSFPSFGNDASTWATSQVSNLLGTSDPPLETHENTAEAIPLSEYGDAGWQMSTAGGDGGASADASKARTPEQTEPSSLDKLTVPGTEDPAEGGSTIPPSPVSPSAEGENKGEGDNKGGDETKGEGEEKGDADADVEEAEAEKQPAKGGKKGGGGGGGAGKKKKKKK